MKLRELKTINVNTLEWFDKINGNSYFASTITLNKGLDNEVELCNKFQYGYDSQHEYKALRAIKEYLNIEDENDALWRFCEAHNIINNVTKRSALLRELKAITV